MTGTIPGSSPGTAMTEPIDSIILPRRPSFAAMQDAMDFDTAAGLHEQYAIMNVYRVRSAHFRSSRMQNLLATNPALSC